MIQRALICWDSGWLEPRTAAAKSDPAAGSSRGLGQTQHDGCMSVDDRTPRTISAAVLKIVNDFDPYGLEPGSADGAPADEYSPESTAMARHLIDNGKITRSDIDSVWLRWFGEPLSTMDGIRLDQFVRDLNAVIGSVP